MEDSILEIKHLTLCLLVSSTHKLCQQIQLRSGPTKCRALSGSDLSHTQMVFQKEFLKKLILKKISRRQKKMKKFPESKE